jgi:hypothetical protein
VQSRCSPRVPGEGTAAHEGAGTPCDRGRLLQPCNAVMKSDWHEAFPFTTHSTNTPGVWSPSRCACLAVIYASGFLRSLGVGWLGVVLRSLDAALGALAGTARSGRTSPGTSGRSERHMSVEARARIAAAQRARWAKQKRRQGSARPAKASGTRKRTMSADARARIAAAQRRRWARVRAGK